MITKKEQEEVLVLAEDLVIALGALASDWSQEPAATPWEDAARELYQILDDIDTLSDIIKPTGIHGLKTYFLAVNERVALRHNVLDTDGYDAYLPKIKPEA